MLCKLKVFRNEDCDEVLTLPVPHESLRLTAEIKHRATIRGSFLCGAMPVDDMVDQTDEHTAADQVAEDYREQIVP